MIIWTLPANVFEKGLVAFLNGAARFDQTDEPITIDFLLVTYWIPAPIVYLCAIVNRWVGNQRPVWFVNHANCKAFQYLQRIDFFESVGLRLPENFQRHAPGLDFVEIAVVPDGPARQVDLLSQRLAGCLSGNQPELDDVRQLAEFSLGEIIANVQQHAGASGFCSAQFVSKHDWARLVWQTRERACSPVFATLFHLSISRI